MVLQLLSSLIYGVIEHSWIISTVFVKYFLAGTLIYSYSREKSFQNYILDYSKEAVTGIVLLGVLLMASGLTVSPLLPNASSLIAVTYFGYVFWKI